jgi:uncharacterized protein (TIGR03663 family)
VSSSSSAAKRQTTSAEKRRAPQPPPPPQVGSEMPERAWLVASAAVLVVAAGLRLYALGLKPMHHDEGVNGFFLMNLLRQGVYHYDPSNYHGPTLYYLTLPFAFVAERFGFLDTWVVRLVPALFGVATVWLVLELRRYVGALGALAAAALVAVSPACVFYSRYFIHESLFVFFTLGLVVAALRFHETAATRYLMLAAASAAMLFATKETAFISVATLGLAWLVAFVWTLPGRVRSRGMGAGDRFAEFFESGRAAAAIAGAFALFAFIWVLFYSSFFSYWQGFYPDSFKAFDIWGKTGMSEFHSKPFSTYVEWLWQEEAPILLLGAAGAAVALFERRKNRFAVFAGAWGFGLLAAYSLISYKTPWLVLSFVVPLAVAGGYAVQRLSDRARAQTRGRGGIVLALFVAGVALAVAAYQSVVLNFREYDNDQYPYVYSHTQRQALDLLKEVERASARAGTPEPGITVVSSEYWPLPWYFRDNPHVGYVGDNVSSYYDPKSTLMVIGRKSDNPKEDTYTKLRPVLAADYAEAGTYPLRPGVTLVLFERRDLAVK